MKIILILIIICYCSSQAAMKIIARDIELYKGWKNNNFKLVHYICIFGSFLWKLLSVILIIWVIIKYL